MLWRSVGCKTAKRASRRTGEGAKGSVVPKGRKNSGWGFDPGNNKKLRPPRKGRRPSFRTNSSTQNVSTSYRPHQAHRSRPRRRPRPREGLLLGIRAGIVSVCPFRIAPRVCGVGDAFRAGRFLDSIPGVKARLKPQAESFRPFETNASRRFAVSRIRRCAGAPLPPHQRCIHLLIEPDAGD